MARRKGARAATRRIVNAKPSEVMQVISQREFQTVLRAVKTHESDKNEAVAGMGGVISQAVERKRLHKRAFSDFRSYERMSDAKLAERLAHFDHYREIGGLNERVTRQGNMIGREPELAEASLEDQPRKPRRRRGHPEVRNPEHLLQAAEDLETTTEY